jgi:hypothetical protein
MMLARAAYVKATRARYVTSREYAGSSTDYVIEFFLIYQILRSQSKALHMIVDAPWYVPNTVIRRNLLTPTVEKSSASALNTVLASAHTQTSSVNLMALPYNRRLLRQLPNDLSTRFLVWLLYL